MHLARHPRPLLILQPLHIFSTRVTAGHDDAFDVTEAMASTLQTSAFRHLLRKFLGLVELLEFLIAEPIDGVVHVLVALVTPGHQYTIDVTEDVHCTLQTTAFAHGLNEFVITEPIGGVIFPLAAPATRQKFERITGMCDFEIDIAVYVFLPLEKVEAFEAAQVAAGGEGC